MSTPQAAAGDRGSLSPSKSPERGAPRRKEAYHVVGRPAADEDDEGSIYVYMPMPQAQVRAPPHALNSRHATASSGLRTRQCSAVQAVRLLRQRRCMTRIRRVRSPHVA
jgi:hypothetical protein